MASTSIHIYELRGQLRRLEQSLSALGSIIKTAPHLTHLDTCLQTTAGMQATLDAMQREANEEV